MGAASYRLLRHTADLRVSVSAPDFPSLCVRGALALASLVADRRRVRPVLERLVPLPGGEEGEAFFAFLRTTLLLLSSDRFLVRSARIVPPDPGGAEGALVSFRGEEADPGRHAFPREVKAVTRHAFELFRTPGGFLRARFVVDV